MSLAEQNLGAVSDGVLQEFGNNLGTLPTGIAESVLRPLDLEVRIHLGNAHGLEQGDLGAA
jgi:hypothetical protein